MDVFGGSRGTVLRLFRHGADHGWKVPVQPDALNLWSSIHRFQVGDNLVVKYDDAADSVLEVTRDDYNRCSTTSPLATHKAAAGAGSVTVPLPRSGPFYFISGKPESCQKGQRVVVVVISEKHSRRGFFAPAAAPSMADGLVGGPASVPVPATGTAGRAAGSGAVPSDWRASGIASSAPSGRPAMLCEWWLGDAAIESHAACRRSRPKRQGQSCP